jgi:hypothetical protein
MYGEISLHISNGILGYWNIIADRRILETSKKNFSIDVFSYHIKIEFTNSRVKETQISNTQTRK